MENPKFNMNVETNLISKHESELRKQVKIAAVIDSNYTNSKHKSSVVTEAFEVSRDQSELRLSMNNRG